MSDFYTVALFDSAEEQMGSRHSVIKHDWCVRTKDGRKLLKRTKLTYADAKELADELNAARAASH